MGQRQPFSAADENAWLSSLVDNFARAEDLHDEPCDPAAVDAAMARLQRPAASRRAKSRRVELMAMSF